MKKITVLLVTATMAFSIQPIKASVGIIIDSNGDVTPPTALIHRDGNDYTFTDNIDCNGIIGIEVQKDEIVIDGDGYSLAGSGIGSGFDLTNRKNITIKYVSIEGFNNGIFLNLCSDNIIRGNNIADNNCGVTLFESYNNSFYHNNFINSNQQVFDISDVNELVLRSVNDWNDVYVSGGNYWSDHILVCDVNNGTDQNITGYDGICDKPYVINANNTDNFPAIYPYELSVHNLDRGLSYYTIQEAIDEANPKDTIYVSGHPLRPDLDADGDVDFFDYSILADRWLDDCNSLDNWCNGLDLNCNCKIDLPDLGILAQGWLEQCCTTYAYYENVVLDKPLKLTGYGACNTTIDGVRKQSVEEDDVVKITQGGSGAWIEGFTIKNAGQSKCGLYLDHTEHNCVTTNRIINSNLGCGIGVYGSNSNDIVNNQIISNNGAVGSVGIDVDDSDSILVSGNRINDTNGLGIVIKDSNNTEVFDNILESNKGGIHITGYCEDNEIRGNKVLSNVGDSNGIVVSGGGDANTTIISNVVSYSYNGIELYGTFNNTISDNNVVNNNNYGLRFDNAANTFIENNAVKSNDNSGIYVNNSPILRITGNEIFANNAGGIEIYNSSDCNIIGNKISNKDANGIEIHNSTCHIIRNVLTSNKLAIELDSSGSVITHNVLMENNVGINVKGDNNTIYHNVFANDVNNAICSGLSNTWDDGWPSGGNFWSDYKDYGAVDANHGKYQDQSGPDYPVYTPYGIGDEKYNIDADDTDGYPVILTSYKITKPLKPEMGKQYELIVELTNDTNEFIPGGTDVNFGGLHQIDPPQPGSWMDWVPDIPSLDDLDLEWPLNYNIDHNFITPSAEIPPEANETFELYFTNEWDWIKPNSWAFVVVDLLACLPGLWDGWSVGRFVQGCYEASKAVPSIEYTFEPNESPLVIFSTDVTIKVPVEKQDDLRASLASQVIAMQWGVCAAVIPDPFSKAACVALAIGFTAASHGLYKSAADPDPDYTEMVELELIATPNDVNELPEGLEKRLALAALKLAFLERAYTESYIRYDGARADSNEYYMGLQLGAAMKYNAMATKKLQEVKFLCPLLTAKMPSININDVNDFREDVDANGLEQIQKDVLGAVYDPNDPNGLREDNVIGMILALTDPDDPNVGVRELRELCTDPNNLHKYMHSMIRAHYMQNYALRATAEAESLPVQYEYDVAITNLWPSGSQVFAGAEVAINVEVENCGTAVATFDVNVYVDTNSIGTQTVSNLVPGEKTRLAFKWDTAEVSIGYYRIEADATITGANDIFEADNTYTGRTIKVCYPYDIDAPSNPCNLHEVTEGVTHDTVPLLWDSSTDNYGVAGYEVYRDSKLIGWSSSTSYTDTALQPNTLYVYTVRAYDFASPPNKSGYSNTCPVTTKPVP